MIWIVILWMALPPTLQPVPAALLPYVHRLRHEPEFAQWLVRHRATRHPLSEYVADCSAPGIKSRQRAFQAMPKFR